MIYSYIPYRTFRMPLVMKISEETIKKATGTRAAAERSLRIAPSSIILHRPI